MGEDETSLKEMRRRAEETRRNIDFIIRQQVQFAADMQQLREVQERAEQRWKQLAEDIGALLLKVKKRAGGYEA